MKTSQTLCPPGHRKHPSAPLQEHNQVQGQWHWWQVITDVYWSTSNLTVYSLLDFTFRIFSNLSISPSLFLLSFLSSTLNLFVSCIHYFFLSICVFLFFVLLIYFLFLFPHIFFLPHFPPSSTHPYFFINVASCFPDLLLTLFYLSLIISYLPPFLLYYYLGFLFHLFFSFFTSSSGLKYWNPDVHPTYLSFMLTVEMLSHFTPESLLLQ